MSGPRGCGGCALLLVDGVLASCSATARSASAWPSSPLGVFALRPTVGSEVTFGTGGAGYFVRFLVCGTRVCWLKCLHSPGL